MMWQSPVEAVIVQPCCRQIKAVEVNSSLVDQTLKHLVHISFKANMKIKSTKLSATREAALQLSGSCFFSVIWQSRVLISLRLLTGFILRPSRIQIPGLDSNCQLLSLLLLLSLFFYPHISCLQSICTFLIILMGCLLASWEAKCIFTMNKPKRE